MNDMASHSDPMILALASYRRPEATDYANAWVGLEPTFQNAKTVRKWHKMSAKSGGEDAYYLSDYMLRMQKKIAQQIKKRYRSQCRDDPSRCPFARVERKADRDQFNVPRQNLLFCWQDDNHEPLEVHVSIDPETFEFGIKPVPLAWFYDDRFVAFLEEFIWKPPLELGLSPSVVHGSAQFSLSAKTFLTGSLLADDIAYRTGHPELGTWIMSLPDCDARVFRATRARLTAFQHLVKDYWTGHFHPHAMGVLTAENAYLDRGFGPARSAPRGLMNRHGGPHGDAFEVFQTNFAFGRAIRLQAQNIH